MRIGKRSRILELPPEQAQYAARRVLHGLEQRAYIRTKRYKFIYCTGKRVRLDGSKTDNPTPGRYVRLYDLQNDPGEFTDVAAQHSDLFERFKKLMLERFRKTHPGAGSNEYGRSVGLVFAPPRCVIIYISLSDRPFSVPTGHKRFSFPEPN